MIYPTHDQVEAMTMANKIVVLSDGFIEPIGLLLELYRSPLNLLVTSFIGSPKMNFLNGAHVDSFDAHTIGVRPVHLKVSDGDGAWKGVVGATEHLGSDTFFRVHSVNETLMVRINGEIDVQHGDTVYLSADRSPAHL